MIFVVLPVHERVEETKKIIACLQNQNCQNYRLILVDDGSTDGSANYVRDSLADKATVLNGNGNLWWAGSLELARKHLESIKLESDDIILIMNNDCIFNGNFFNEIISDIHKFPDALILARCYDQETHEILDKGVNVNWKDFKFTLAQTPEEINALSTRGLYFKYSLFKKIGKFHPLLLPHYASDYEFTSRAQKRGLELKVSDEAELFLNQKTTGVHELDYTKGLKYLFNNLFLSKKSSKNVLYWTVYIIMACDKRYIFINLIRVYGHTAKFFLKWMKYKLFGVNSV